MEPMCDHNPRNINRIFHRPRTLCMNMEPRSRNPHTCCGDSQLIHSRSAATLLSRKRYFRLVHCFVGPCYLWRSYWRRIRKVDRVCESEFDGGVLEPVRGGGGRTDKSGLRDVGRRQDRDLHNERQDPNRMVSTVSSSPTDPPRYFEIDHFPSLRRSGAPSSPPSIPCPLSRRPLRRAAGVVGVWPRFEGAET